jgi:hypothetical protein
MDIVTFPMERLVGGNMHDDIKVSRWNPLWARFSLTF